MPVSMSRLGGAVLGLALIVGAGGCSRIRDHKGFVADETLIAAVRPGVDNRESVEGTLGRPSFAGQFDNGQTWYYVARDTRQFAFSRPRPVSTMVLAVHFDATGNVASIDKSGMERIVSIHPDGAKTPTLGRERGFFSELFGNIGSVGAASQGGGTADNPNPN
jgi:outer membrane protein assembly factor BamE (lipoprotein component of BamABCDE complex)